MIYYIDGYNFMFRLEGSQKRSLEERRCSLIDLLNSALQTLKVPVSIIFDSSETIREFPQCAVLSHLEVLYAPKGLTADAYIIELVDQSANPKIITVVTSDSGLARQCQHLGAKVMPIDEFLAFLLKKQKSAPCEKPSYRECKNERERLRKIFEERLKGDRDST